MLNYRYGDYRIYRVILIDLYKKGLVNAVTKRLYKCHSHQFLIFSLSYTYLIIYQWSKNEHKCH